MAVAMNFLLLLSPTALRIAPTFLVLGAAFHQCIRTFEIDNRLSSLLYLYLTSFLILCGNYVLVYSLSVPYAIGSALFATACFNTGLTISILVYRAFFHSLRQFPGPWNAKLSRLALVHRAIKRTQYHLDLQDMHKRYGDFVRTGPREISINRASAVSALYGLQSACTRSPWYSHVSDDWSKTSLNSTRDPNVHRRRRKVWDHAFSTKAIASYELSVQQKVEVLATKIRSRLNQPLDASQWSMYFAFDVMGLIGFSKDFHQLEDGSEQAAIKELHGQMLFLGILKPAPWILTILGAIRNLVGEYGQFMTYCEDRILEQKEKWISNSEKVGEKVPTNVISWLLKAMEEKDPSAPPGDQALNEDGRLLIIAGRNPSAYRILQEELDRAFGATADPSQLTNERLQTLPYLEAVINETLRLKPAVPSGQPRVTPPEGLRVDEVWIPGGTIVVAPQYVIGRDERNFPSGSEFMPERWLDEKQDLIKHEEAFFPFQLGRYSCVGKQLALIQLRSFIARVAYEFDLSFADGEDGVSFDVDSKDTFTYTIGPLNVVFTSRGRKEHGNGYYMNI